VLSLVLIRGSSICTGFRFAEVGTVLVRVVLTRRNARPEPCSPPPVPSSSGFWVLGVGGVGWGGWGVVWICSLPGSEMCST
jgi:hypothetical protein